MVLHKSKRTAQQLEQQFELFLKTLSLSHFGFPIGEVLKHYKNLSFYFSLYFEGSLLAEDL
jgi:hypothetical protein